MAEKRELEFFLLRYVPDAVKGEFVNIGVVSLEDGPQGKVLADVRFARDRSRLLCMDPEADLDLLATLQEEIRGEIGKPTKDAELWQKMEDSFSGLIQVSPVMPVLTERIAATEMDEVVRMFLETARVRRTREPSGRRKILSTMRQQFEKAGVLALLNEVPVESYTKPGDPFAFDFGYRVRGEIKLFHAVSLKASVDAAVMLAARYPKIAPVMEKMIKAVPALTAVVDDDLDRGQEAVQFALGMMEEEKIRIAVAAEMPRIAEVARVELKA